MGAITSIIAITIATRPIVPTSTARLPARVASFDGGVLTLTLANGSTVSGAVADETEIGCIVADPTPPPPTARTAHHGDDDHGDAGDWATITAAITLPTATRLTWLRARPSGRPSSSLARTAPSSSR